MSERVDFFMPGDDTSGEAFRYEACGLDYVYLLNGVVKETDEDYGEIITIKSQGELHRAICAHIVGKPKMTGREFKFLRKLMGFTQEKLAEEFEVDVQTIANYEKKAAIPKTSQKLMRWHAALFLLPEDTKLKVIRALVEGEKGRTRRGGDFSRERGKLLPHWHERGQLAAC